MSPKQQNLVWEGHITLPLSIKELSRAMKYEEACGECVRLGVCYAVLTLTLKMWSDAFHVVYLVGQNQLVMIKVRRQSGGKRGGATFQTCACIGLCRVTRHGTTLGSAGRVRTVGGCWAGLQNHS